jgi:sec-independent protein translocase protein TatA
MIPNIGPLEILVVLIIALVVFGPKRIPELGSSLGKGITSFRRGLDAKEEEEPTSPEQPAPVLPRAKPRSAAGASEPPAGD